MSEERSLPRILGFWDVVTIAVSAIIGVGIFFTPASVMGRTQSGGTSLLVWIGGGVIAVLGALTFAELGAMMPKVGGQFAVVREAFGRRIGFLSVASVTLTVQAGAIGILAIVCASNVFRGFGVAASRPEVTVGALAAIAIVYGINVAGVRLSARVLRANVCFKLLVIAAIVTLAANSTAPRDPAAFSVGAWPGAGVFVYALIPTLFSYGGFEQVLWAAGEVRNPGRNIVLGILVGVGIVVVAYIGTNVAFLSLLGASGVLASGELLTANAVEAGAPGFGFLVAFAVAISALGTTHAIVLTAPRQILALAQDGLAPRVLTRISPRTATPVPATTLIAVTSALLVLLAGPHGLEALLDAVICVNWFVFGLTAAALVRLRRKLPDLARPFRVPLYPLVPLVFALIAFAAAASPFFQDRGRVPALWAVGLLLTLALASRLWIMDRVPARERVR
jgi:APA family basic amino acid/polyamine antiporter